MQVFVFLITFFVILFAVTIHEVSHALVAYYLGDPTAKYLGRITFNPFAHIDLFGTVLLPILLLLSGFPPFGYAKPVPINPANFSHPRRDSAFTALAGPLSNFLVAIIIAIPLKYFKFHGFDESFGYQLLKLFFDINVVLLTFNILPFPPLDGSKIIGFFIPNHFAYAYERFLNEGLKYFMIFFMFDLFLGQRLYGFSVFSVVIGNIRDFFQAIIGLGT